MGQVFHINLGSSFWKAKQRKKFIQADIYMQHLYIYIKKRGKIELKMNSCWFEQCLYAQQAFAIIHMLPGRAGENKIWKQWMQGMTNFW